MLDILLEIQGIRCLIIFSCEFIILKLICGLKEHVKNVTSVNLPATSTLYIVTQIFRAISNKEVTKSGEILQKYGSQWSHVSY